MNVLVRTEHEEGRYLTPIVLQKSSECLLIQRIIVNRERFLKLIPA